MMNMPPDPSMMGMGGPPAMGGAVPPMPPVPKRKRSGRHKKSRGMHRGKKK